MAQKPMLNRLLMRRITSVMAIRDNHREIIGFKASCNHSSPPETKIYPLSQWGSIAYDLAEDWALNHKCRGDNSQSEIIKAMTEISQSAPRKLHSVTNGK